MEFFETTEIFSHIMRLFELLPVEETETYRELFLQLPSWLAFSWRYSAVFLSSSCISLYKSWGKSEKLSKQLKFAEIFSKFAHLNLLEAGAMLMKWKYEFFSCFKLLIGKIDDWLRWKPFDLKKMKQTSQSKLSIG